MTEYRRDPVMNQWVIIETENSWTPEQYEKSHNDPWQTFSPFAPGREGMTPPEVASIRSNGSGANKEGWDARVISNKFPALKIEGEIDLEKIGCFEHSNGVGAHEIVVETTDPHRQMADFSHDEMVNVIRLYQQRINDLRGDKRFKYIMIFKNFGSSAGATIEHAHSQIIALPMIPKSISQELNGTRAYYEKNKRCIFCDILVSEQDNEKRIISENEAFISFCPFVSHHPFEIWIMPKKHSSKFSTISAEDQGFLADLVIETMGRLKRCLDNPSFNYYLHISPINYEGDQSFHWHMEIVPQLTKPTGFEWGTGFYIVQTDPNHAAEYLRNA